MIHGKIKSLKGTRYIKKMHFCPDCKIALEPVTLSRQAKTPEEKRKYSNGPKRGLHYAGTVEYTWYELKCPHCLRQLSLDEMQKIEYEQMDAKAQKQYEKKEKLKVFAFKLALFLFGALLILFFILSKS